MKLLLLSALTLTAHAALNGRCSGSAATGLWRDDGICITTSNCNSYGGSYIHNACPNDPENVKCCRIEGGGSSGCASSGYSWCDWTSDGCPGSFLVGYCPGGNNYRCCRL